MRVVAVEEQGTPARIAVLDMAEPPVLAGEVCVGVKAAALNHLDLWTASGSLGIPIDLPFVLGADGAGIVEAVGAGVPDALIGQRVMINPGISCGRCENCLRGEQSECFRFEMLGEHRQGTLAEKVVVPQENVHPFPDHLSFQEAAALGVTFITAYRMLFTKGRLRPGESVLITGIGGGLALSLLQLARQSAGVIFVTSSSGEKLERAISLGANHGIDYRDEDIGKTVRALTAKRGVDLVLDSAGGETLDGALRALRPGGRMVIAGATAGRESTLDMRRLFGKQLSIHGSTMGSASDVNGMLKMVGGAKLRPIIDRVFDLEEGPEAIEYLTQGQQFGKIVVSLES